MGFGPTGSTEGPDLRATVDSFTKMSTWCSEVLTKHAED